MSYLGYDYLFKILMVGDANVGKTSLLHRFCGHTFDDEHWLSYDATIGVDFETRTKEIDGKLIKFQIWDTAGQERFRALTSSYYRGTQGVMIVYSVADLRSFENLDYWLNEIELHGSNQVSKVLVGTKSDLQAARVVTYDRGMGRAAKNELEFFETSAKLPVASVEEPFLALAQAIKSQGPSVESPAVSRPFPSWNRSTLTEIYLCRACSYQEIEGRNARRAAGRPTTAPRRERPRLLPRLMGADRS